MKQHITYLFLLPFLSGCSLIGAKIGKEVDRSIFGDIENKHKYESKYMVEGLEEDIEIIKEIFSKKESENKYIDPDPCKDINSIQICTLKKGCWCEIENNN
ncbi:MAG: hypothetical protein PVJ68_09620 [Candidatus Thiodiazotropha sp.]|jgi:hypothetical protein